MVFHKVNASRSKTFHSCEVGSRRLHIYLLKQSAQEFKYRCDLRNVQTFRIDEYETNGKKIYDDRKTKDEEMRCRA